MCLQQRSFTACPLRDIVYDTVVWFSLMLSGYSHETIHSQTHTENLYLTCMQRWNWPLIDQRKREIFPTLFDQPDPVSLAPNLTRPTSFNIPQGLWNGLLNKPTLLFTFCRVGLPHVHCNTHTHTLTFIPPPPPPPHTDTYILLLTLTWLRSEGSAFHLSKVLATLAWPFWLAKCSGVNPE